MWTTDKLLEKILQYPFRNRDDASLADNTFALRSLGCEMSIQHEGGPS